MTEQTQTPQSDKARLNFIIRQKLVVWQSIYGIYNDFMVRVAPKHFDVQSENFLRMASEMRLVKTTLDYCDYRESQLSEVPNTMTWEAFLIIDEDLKTRLNLINILFTKLELTP